MKQLLILLCISPLLLVSCMKKDAAGGDAAMKADSTKQKNIENYKAVLEIFNSGKYDDLGKYISDNFTDHDPDPGQKPGLAGLKESMGQFHAAFPDLKFTVKDVTSDGDLIWGHINISGTNTGSMMGMPPTGKKIDVNGVDIVKIKDGKAIERWGYYQERLMMEQMGMMPPPGGPPPAGGDMKKGDMKKG